MNLSTNKDKIPTYEEKLRDRVVKTLAGVAIVGALAGAIHTAPNINPEHAKPLTHLAPHERPAQSDNR